MPTISKLARRLRLVPVAAIAALLLAMDGRWMTIPPAVADAGRRTAQAPVTTPSASPGHADRSPPTQARKNVGGRINLNTATEDQLRLLPTVGPAKAERVVAWRKKNGGFKRIADLRRVKGFGYKTFKRLEPFLDIQGETTLVAKR